MLRKAGETVPEKPRRVTLKDLYSDLVADMGRSTSITITVNRGTGKGTIKEVQRAGRRG